METFSAVLAICAGNSPVPGEFLAQRPVTRSFDVFFDLRLNKRLNKQSSCLWFETISRPLWCHSNETRRELFKFWDLVRLILEIYGSVDLGRVSVLNVRQAITWSNEEEACVTHPGTSGTVLSHRGWDKMTYAYTWSILECKVWFRYLYFKLNVPEFCS